MKTTTLESCLISPQPSSNDTVELTIPLTFLDILWLRFPHPIRRLLFYKYPSCSREFFSEALIPKLKESLSTTLKHYLPVSGNLVYPANKDDPTIPFIRYKEGDAVSFTVAESDKNFDEMVKEHSRDADQFYDFVPQMPPFGDEPGYRIIPLVAFQVTLFEGRGFCIGFSNHHCLGDGNSMVGFIKAWASICKLGGDDCLISGDGDLSLPLLDRSVIRDPTGIDNIYWKVMREIPLNPPSFPLPTGRYRATYTLHQSDINNLKNYVLAKKPGLGHVSSFVVATSYAWTCFVKSNDDSGVNSDPEELFIFPTDIRSRVDPPLPRNYFGNCVSGGFANIENRILIGEEGFITAAEKISSEIKNRVNNKDEVRRALKDAANWLSMGSKLAGKRTVGVSGSPKFDLYEVDFGWGRAEKVEVVSIDGEKYSMSLCKSRVSDGGIEIGFSLPKETMEAFEVIFEDGLKKMKIL